MDNSPVQRHGRIDDIEVLRAVAVIIVCVSHCGVLFPWTKNPLGIVSRYLTFWSGVDLFFAISGFVIARSLLPQLAKTEYGSLDFWKLTFAFWVRRAYRLLPSAWIWVAFPLVASIFLPEYFGRFSQNFPAAIASILDVANFHLWGVGRWGQSAGMLGVYWSLSLEEQFYILLPIAILLFRKKFVTILIILFIVQTFLPDSVWSWTRNFPWAIRTEAIILGVLLAIFHEKEISLISDPIILRRRWVSFPIVCLLILCVMAVPSNEGKIFVVPFSVGILAAVCCALVFIASFDKNYILPDGRIKKLLVWIGERSYAIYLVNLPSCAITLLIWKLVMGKGFSFGPAYFFPLLLTSIAIMAALADLNFRFIETPIRIRGKIVASNMMSVPLGRDIPIASKLGSASSSGRVMELEK